MLTSAALLERRSDTYEVAERRHLAQVAALVRFIDQPQWVAVEWTDGARPSMYITPSRDAFLTALLDAAQVGMHLWWLPAAMAWLSPCSTYACGCCCLLPAPGKLLLSPLNINTSTGKPGLCESLISPGG